MFITFVWNDLLCNQNCCFLDWKCIFRILYSDNVYVYHSIFVCGICFVVSSSIGRDPSKIIPSPGGSSGKFIVGELSNEKRNVYVPGV